jgi:hypothetical protein
MTAIEKADIRLLRVWAATFTANASFGFGVSDIPHEFQAGKYRENHDENHAWRQPLTDLCHPIRISL